MTPQEILKEIYNLPLTEREEIFDSLSKDLTAEECEEKRLQEVLLEVGLLRELKPPRRRKIGEFNAVKINGKPLSETIIEERR
jgi:hypothetical protein